jgi:hypothetical protein
LKFLKQLSSLLKISVSVLFILSTSTASGIDSYRSPAGAAEAGMAYVCIMKTGFWSSFHNQANLGFNKSFSIGFNYENRFNIGELATRSAGLIIPAGKTSLAATYSHFGYSEFKRDFTGLACGMKLSEKISAGVQADYYSIRTSGEYNNHQAITYEAGVVVLPTESIQIGVHFINLLPGSLKNKLLPTSLRVGAGTRLNKSVFTGIEAEMYTGSKLLIRTGMEYGVSKYLWLRGGYCTENNSFSFGLGLLAKFVQIDLGFVTHEKLGVTSSASLIFKINKN